MRTFTPVGKIIKEAETVEQKLHRMARASLPVCVNEEERKRGRKRTRYCDCGVILGATPKTRQGRLVCDVCASIIPRLPAGRRPTYSCHECHTVLPYVKLKMKNRQFYCKKCLKIKFQIDF